MSSSASNPDVFTSSNGSPSTLSDSTINSELNAGTSVTVQTSSADIDVSAGTNINKTSGGSATLLLNSYGNIVFNGTGSGSNSINIASSSNALNVTLDSDTGGSGGAISLAYTNITTNGGNITMVVDQIR